MKIENIGVGRIWGFHKDVISKFICICNLYIISYQNVGLLRKRFYLATFAKIGLSSKRLSNREISKSFCQSTTTITKKDI